MKKRKSRAFVQLYTVHTVKFVLFFYFTISFLFLLPVSSIDSAAADGRKLNLRPPSDFRSLPAFLHVDLININLIQEERKRKIDFFNAHSLCVFVLVRFGAAAVASFISSFFQSTIYLFICLLFPGR